MNRLQYAKRYGFGSALRREWVHLREWVLEDQAGQGLGGPPNNWQGLPTFDVQRREAHEKGGLFAYGYNARFNNDAHEIWIGTREIDKQGTHEHWAFHCSASAFRKIALWYLFRWAWGEWFGLRRWLYYKWLTKHVHRLRPGGEAER